MSDGSPLPNRTEETPVTGRDYPDDDPEGRRWSEIWRAVAEELSANALVSDLATNRLDYTPEDGTLFVPTDGGDWFIGDGSSWNNLGAIGDVDSELALKADADGGGTDELTNYSLVQSDTVETTNFSIAGVTFWVSDTEPADAAADDVWIETNWQS